MGRAAKDAANLGAGEEYLRSLGAEVFWSDRGGDATFHGPGQIVGYPILRLKARDTHAYLRELEEVLIRVLADYGLEGWHHPEYTGVWVADHKIAAIGVKFSSGWITSHGFALNVKTDLSWFDRITPCGIKEFGVTSLSRELDREISLAEVEAEDRRPVPADVRLVCLLPLGLPLPNLHKTNAIEGGNACWKA